MAQYDTTHSDARKRVYILNDGTRLAVPRDLGFSDSIVQSYVRHIENDPAVRGHHASVKLGDNWYHLENPRGEDDIYTTVAKGHAP